MIASTRYQRRRAIWTEQFKISETMLVLQESMLIGSPRGW